MSASGQKQTFAPQKIMSALPLIATVKADIALEDAAPQGGTGNLRAVQLLLGHTTIESNVRYLGMMWPMTSP